MGLLARLRRSSHIHDSIGDLFRRHLDGGTILDVPAGDGVNSRRLQQAGFDVRPADIFPEDCRVEGVACDGVDMCRPLPYEDGTFEGVLHSEGIEHVDNQIEVLAELARVLKPGGVLVVTTPNLLHLSGRLSFLLTAHRHPRKSAVAASEAYWAGKPDEEGRTYFGHVFLINYFQLRFYLTHVGLDVVEVDAARYSLNSVLLAPLLWPPVYFSTRRLLRARGNRIPPDLRASLIKESLGGPVLFGPKLIMVAGKP
jgi:SAM-dependent methyltransferase